MRATSKDIQYGRGDDGVDVRGGRGASESSAWTLRTGHGDRCGWKYRKNKDTMCWTPEDAKDVVKTIATAGKDTACTVSDVKTAPWGSYRSKSPARERAATSHDDCQ